MWNNQERKRTFQTWSDMKRRCFKTTCHNYPHYGARGITVCDRWLGPLGFQNFSEDMGMRPKSMTLERVNNDGNYEPSNCRWATRDEQRQNQRNCSVIRFNGISDNYAGWGSRIGISRHAIRNRIKSGWPLHLALSEGKATGHFGRVLSAARKTEGAS